MNYVGEALSRVAMWCGIVMVVVSIAVGACTGWRTPAPAAFTGAMVAVGVLGGLSLVTSVVLYLIWQRRN